jgi:short-subunit dehydrogenase
MSSTNATTVLITGATSGIGRTTALHLAARGYSVFASGRSERALAEVAAEARAAGCAIETVRLDVTDQDSILRARQRIDNVTGARGVDVLINNAGYGTAGPVLETTDAEVRAQYDTNVFGVLAVTRAFAPQMCGRRAGRILNVSSVGGRLTLPFMGVYNSTKYAIESLSDALRMELEPFGVHVVIIEPGFIRTGFSERSMQELHARPSQGSPWAAVLERADKIRRMSDDNSADPACVARAMERAIRARRPRARYMAPLRERLLLPVALAMPTRWLDGIMKKTVGLTRRRLGPPPTPQRLASPEP